MTGKLTLVPTPVGNLQDMSFRAVETLKNADAILAENTRNSRILLKHFDIKTNLISHHKFNEHKTSEKLAQAMHKGAHYALISDAGTPAISDPGYLLVTYCIKYDVTVECIPGPTAFVPALAVSGLPNDSFVFEGFLPHKKGRMKRIKALENEQRTMVFYESPYRVIKLLEQLSEILGPERHASVSRELSKKFEETKRGSLSKLAAHFKEHKPRGEFVVVVSGEKKHNINDNFKTHRK
ncbi:MAG: 16S rRNA (cytidine(1402)-2'-O)-methyltransferase [Bacteroidota bacterium]|nr:16S rRNA (cytidine(1402)-2'-O)-methyltransferase [Bacteroidota bacterium]